VVCLKKMILGAVIVLAALALVFFGGQSVTGNVLSSSAVDANAAVFQIKSTSFAFEPNEIRVKSGQKVRLEVTVPKGDPSPHSLALPDFGINKYTELGQTTAIEFVANKPAGTYDGFCSFWCGTGHRDMKFKVIVE